MTKKYFFLITALFSNIISNKINAVSDLTVFSKETTTTGYVNSSELIAHTEEGKKIQEQITKREDLYRSQIMAKEEELKKAIEIYKVNDTKKAMMSEAAKKDAEAKLMELQRSYQALVTDLQTDLNNFAQKLMSDFSLIIEGEIEKFAKNNNYDVIFDIATGKIIYCAAHLNKTATLISLVDTKVTELANTNTKTTKA